MAADKKKKDAAAAANKKAMKHVALLDVGKAALARLRSDAALTLKALKVPELMGAITALEAAPKGKRGELERQLAALLEKEKEKEKDAQPVALPATAVVQPAGEPAPTA